jgi:ClpP class serine protease
MEFNLSTLLGFAFLALMLQPLLTGRMFTLRRARASLGIKTRRRSRVITMIHRQEKHSLLGCNMSQMIGLENAQSIISAIKATPRDMPIDLVLHTPVGLVLADVSEKVSAQVKRGAVEFLPFDPPGCRIGWTSGNRRVRDHPKSS